MNERRITYQPTASGFFSGVGGMDLGFAIAGVKMVQSLDLDEKAKK